MKSCGFYRIVMCISHNGHVNICIMVMKILQNSRVNNWSWHMSGLCHVNLQNAHVDLQSGHANFIECSSVFCIMVMKILQNSRVNNWSGHMSGSCHVNFAECS